jgi:Spy/CpxP family protein refolding chaperone
MKKITVLAAVLLALVITLGLAGYAYAQTQPETPYGSGMMGRWGQGGMMGERDQGAGMMGQRGYGLRGGMISADGIHGPMHDYMLEALSVKLGLTVEELQDRLDNGETMWDIAVGQGLSAEEISTAMLSARSQALELAVEAGVITPKQADWMNSHMESMNGRGPGSGGCHGTPSSGLTSGSTS